MYRYWGYLDSSQVIVVLIEKYQDYELWNGTTTIKSWCMPRVFPTLILLIESHDMSLAIIQGDSRAVVAYLSRLTFQVSVLFNIAIIIASLLFGKILTNFIEQKPGLAGFRVF